MLPIKSFNPGDTSIYPNGVGVINVGAADAGAKILFYNESNYNLLIGFLNGNQDILHAWEARWWPLDGDTKQLDWSIDSVLTFISAPPISKVMGTLYGANEQVPGTYPISLLRQTNTGNAVSTVSGPATKIQSDGNPAATSILETSVPGTTSNQNATNDGIWNLSIIIAGVLHQFFKTQTSGAVLQLGNGGDTVEVLGGLSADKGIYAGFPSFSDAQLNVQSLTTGQVAAHIASLGPSQTADILDVTDATGNKFLSVDHAGAVSISTTLKLLTGSLTRISVFTASGVTTAGVLFNHGLGVVPDLVLVSIDGATTGTFSCIVDYSTLSSTQVKLTSSINGMNVHCIAIKV